MAAILRASHNPPQWHRSGWMTWQASFSKISRKPCRVANRSPVAIGTELARRTSASTSNILRWHRLLNKVGAIRCLRQCFRTLLSGGRTRVEVLRGIPAHGFATVTVPSVRVQRYPTPQLIEEVQQEYHAFARLLGSFGRHERYDVFTVGRGVIGPRRTEGAKLFLGPNARLIRHERISTPLIGHNHEPTIGKVPIKQLVPIARPRGIAGVV